MPHDYVIVLTTLPPDAHGGLFARTLVEEGLAACVNVHAPMTSTYRWKGKIEVDEERPVTIKTHRDRLAALEDRVRELHTYEVPEFVVIPIGSGSEAYLRWIGESVEKR